MSIIYVLLFFCLNNHYSVTLSKYYVLLFFLSKDEESFIDIFIIVHWNNVCISSDPHCWL